MSGPPYAYVVTQHDGFLGAEILSVGVTLDRALGLDRVLGRALGLICGKPIAGSVWGKQMVVTAYFLDGSQVVVPREAYAERVFEDDQEALIWIRKRKSKIEAARAAHDKAPLPARHKLWQENEDAGRCNWRDPEAKQLADYHATSPWAWRDTPDETWWQGVRAALSGGC